MSTTLEEWPSYKFSFHVFVLIYAKEDFNSLCFCIWFLFCPSFLLLFYTLYLICVGLFLYCLCYSENFPRFCVLICIWFLLNQVCFAGSCIFSWWFNADDSVSVCHHGGDHKQLETFTSYYACSSYIKGMHFKLPS